MGKAIKMAVSVVACLVACGETAKHPGSSQGGSSSADAGAAPGGAPELGGTNAAAGAMDVASGAPAGGAGGNNPEECPSDAIDFDQDPNHCGSCSNVCGAHNACVAGKCTPDLITVAQVPNCGSLALQIAPGNYSPQVIYALATKSGTLHKIELPDVGQGAPQALATGLTGSAAFDLSWGAMVTAGMAVTSIDLETAMKRVIATDSSTIFAAATFADGDIVYATSAGVKYVDLSNLGTTGEVIAPATGGATPRSLASSLDQIFYTTEGANDLLAIRPPDYSPVTIATDQKGLLFGHRSLQVDETNLYWANGSLQMAPLDDPAHPVSTIAHPIDNSPVVAYAVTASDDIAYIATKDGSFEKAHFDSKDTAVWLARALPAVTSIVMDDTNVYVASDCQILKKPRLVFDETGTGSE